MKMSDLVEEYHYQKSYYYKLILNYTGMSYNDYLISIRIQKAKDLLANSSLSIEDIISMVGYNNKGFFYRIFKESTGVTPAKYRKDLFS